MLICWLGKSCALLDHLRKSVGQAVGSTGPTTCKKRATSSRQERGVGGWGGSRGGGTHAPQGPFRHCPFLTGRYKSECRQRAVLVCNLSSVPRVSSFLTSSPVPETQVSLLASGFKLPRKGLGWWAPGLADYNLELST